jgi:vacuolar protein sorting-associated protein VTA1
VFVPPHLPLAPRVRYPWHSHISPGEYRAVNQIVGKSLHTTGDDAFAYTKTLIDRLEATKVEHADDDSIVDNDAAKAYVEQFAQQTFDRAERTLRANKVTRWVIVARETAAQGRGGR